jgi:hypothetical protein
MKMNGDTVVYRTGSMLCGLLALMGMVPVVYNLWTGWYFAVGCFFVVPVIPLLLVAILIWRMNGNN